ncbi:MAG TPA: SH3 domain-containing protein [Candidatus Binatia bacterium]|nr:SH3 domain-containing protein [Candidatus Binatia bacterium]
MRSARSVLCGTALVLLGLVPPAVARTVTLRETARLRESATKDSALVGDLPAGTTLEVTGEEAGWLKVEAPDGRSGYVWGAHVRTASEGGQAPAETARRTEAPEREASGAGLADTLNEIKAGVSALRQSPPPASADDLAKLREQIERLAQGQEDLAKRLEERAEPTDAPLDGTGVAWAALAVGLFVGWVLGLVTRRRRARRQHDRIRL